MQWKKHKNISYIQLTIKLKTESLSERQAIKQWYEYLMFLEETKQLQTDLSFTRYCRKYSKSKCVISGNELLFFKKKCQILLSPERLFRAWQI